MNHSRRLIGCAVGALMIATWATTFDASAAPRAVSGCRGLSPASAQDCTADQLQAALDR